MNDPVDVLIIGAGASGAAVAWSLAETKMHILCLEQGGWMNPANYPSTGRDWEARFFGDCSPSPNIRGRPEDYPINDDNSPIKVVNFNGVGGGTVMYTAHWPRLHPSDFRVQTLDGVADDWPIDYDTLTPFFEENDRMMGVVRPGRRSRLSPPTHPPMPPLPLGSSGAMLGKAMNQLGWHWWPSDTTVATIDYEGRARCINLGHCTPACAQGAKASTDITYWPQRSRAGVELRTHCRVREITTDEHGMASGVVYYDKDGNEQFQPAHVVMLACNGVGTPRLLLNSASGRFPNGLANSQRPRRQEPDVPPLCAGLRLCRGADRQQPRAADLPVEQGVLRDRPVARLRARLHVPVRPRRRAGIEAVVSEAKGLLPWGADHHAVFRRLNGHRLGLSAICEDLPEEHNRVTLDPVLKDSNGIPAPQDRLHDRREHAADDGARHRPREGDPGRGRRDRHLRQQPDPLRRLASARHRAHGHRPGALGGQRMGPRRTT